MKKLLPVFFILLSVLSFAQSNSKNGSGYFGINLMGGVPMGEFSNYNEDMAIGVGINFFYQPSDNIPVLVGLDLNFLGNGTNVQDETITAEIKVGETVIDEIVFPFRIETHNSIFTGHFITRVVAPIKYFKPYVDGIVGFQNF